jgi:hypothetical protein
MSPSPNDDYEIERGYMNPIFAFFLGGLLFGTAFYLIGKRNGKVVNPVQIRDREVLLRDGVFRQMVELRDGRLLGAVAVGDVEYFAFKQNADAAHELSAEYAIFHDEKDILGNTRMCQAWLAKISYGKLVWEKSFDHRREVSVGIAVGKEVKV